MASRFDYVLFLNFDNFSMCEHIIYGKKIKSSHKKIGKRKGEPLELVRSDVCGRIPTISLGGAS